MSAIEKIDNEMHNVRTGEISINEKAMSAWNELDFTIQSCHRKASYLIGFATALAKEWQSHQPAPEKIQEQGAIMICDLKGNSETVIAKGDNPNFWNEQYEKQSTPNELEEEVKWISVEDETPKLIDGKDYSENVFTILSGELAVMCYCFVPDDDGAWGYVWANCYGNIEGECEWDDDYNPTHWMPLPKPPTKP